MMPTHDQQQRQRAVGGELLADLRADELDAAQLDLRVGAP